MNYKEYLASSRIAKSTLALLVVDILAAIFIVVQLARYMGAIVAVIGSAATILIGALVWLCHYKKPKGALVIEIFITIFLIIGIVVAAKINSIAGEISRTTEYEVVQIVTLKGSDIEPADDLSNYTIGYTNSDDGAYERSSEILVDNNKKVKESKPYELSLIHI